MFKKIINSKIEFFKKLFGTSRDLDRAKYGQKNY